VQMRKSAQICFGHTSAIGTSDRSGGMGRNELSANTIAASTHLPYRCSENVSGRASTRDRARWRNCGARRSRCHVPGTDRLEPEQRPGWQGPALAPSGSRVSWRAGSASSTHLIPAPGEFFASRSPLASLLAEPIQKSHRNLQQGRALSRRNAPRCDTRLDQPRRRHNS
jgi:hypothetical protein